MIHVFATVEAPTVAELLRQSESVVGAGVRLGVAALTRFGAALVASFENAVVFADARIAGRPDELAVAAKALASAGARFLSVDARSPVEAVDNAVTAAAQHGAKIVLVGVPPGAPEPPGGRGRAVTTAARVAAGTSARLLLGEIPDIGVVAQVSSGLGVIVEVADAEEAADAAARGAAGLVVPTTDAVASIMDRLGRPVPSDHG